MALNKNDKINLHIIDLNDDGDGVAKVDGQVVFVPNALVGEQVETTIINTKSKFAIAKVTQVLSTSQDRVQPRCPYYGKCGGCALQHMNYKSQLAFKTHIVQKAFHNNAKIDLEVFPCIGSTEWRYRNKIALPSGNGTIGMYRKNTHNIVEISDCPITQEWVKPLVQILQDYIKTNNISLYDENTSKGLVRHIVARNINNQLLVTVVVNGKALPQAGSLYNELKKHFPIAGLNININTNNSNVILSDNWIHLYGIKALEGNDFGIVHPISNASFYQVNDEIKTKIYQQVLDNIDSSDTVIDAYSGAGLMSSIVARKATKCYGVEIIPQATIDADLLAKQNGIKNLININGDCSVELPKLIKKISNSTIILDPPRKGCDSKVLETIVSSKPNKIIYVSCNPQTLARDSKYFLDNDYTISIVQPYDMFPQTPHVETVAVFIKK